MEVVAIYCWILGGALFASLVYAVIASAKLNASRLKSANLATSLESTVNELHKTESKLNVLLDALHAGVLVVDEHGKVIEMNQVASNRFGDFVGEKLIEATLSIELSEAVEAPIKRGLATTVEFEYGANRLPMRGTVVPLDHGALCVVEDVTQIKRLETARRDFVANVSHELRTPLASIRAMAETLVEGARKDESVADRYLRIIVSESDRLTRIAEDLLMLSRAETQEPQRTKFDFGQLVSEVVHRFSLPSSVSSVSLESSIEQGRTVFADRSQVTQAVINLVDNALKYSHPGGKVKVSVYGEEGHGVLSVEDQGVGIAHEDVDRIFERFYRVDRARSRKSGGTGLGLSIVKHVAESNGGRVDVKSELNHGSTFYLFLPTATEPKTKDSEGRN